MRADITDMKLSQDGTLLATSVKMDLSESGGYSIIYLR